MESLKKHHKNEPSCGDFPPQVHHFLTACYKKDLIFVKLRTKYNFQKVPHFPIARDILLKNSSAKLSHIFLKMKLT